MKCPKCGEEMEEGYFMITAGGYPSLGLWSTENPSHRKFWDSLIIPESSIKVMWSAAILRKAKDTLKGFRCANCKLITFEY